ncbi:Cys-tRNA(Pro) deacylase [Paenibacillus sp. TRM 82003]|uniref:Cys-tRNA(Pro) deacylase n=1 Tax=Kineococcus sp. TRM81007 TaxID=2925831 RepID=UPI001F56F74B|nr:Cys-tRNA(Pro) deacylase [Kineococcus sp. TRM81007]MCI2239718.1 Cys-tRNA(Pro) deacylase [Kineococcus sp. TRM81007]MCI3926719.1 Cys-tRNA(Pro) deacylase [Paenibacillus sp. TRM 82003]
MAKHRGARPEAGTPALRALAERGTAHTVHPYEHDPTSTAYGEEAVRALREKGVDVTPERLFKTLLVDVDGRLAVAVVPVAAMLDLKAVAAAAGGKKAAMADPVRAQRSSGYVVGGISPLGQRTTLPTVVDSSAEGFATVFVSAGRRGLQVELAPGDLLAATGGRYAAVARS